MALHAHKRLHDHCSVFGGNARAIVVYKKVHLPAFDLATDKHAALSMLHRVLQQRVESTLEDCFRD